MSQLAERSGGWPALLSNGFLAAMLAVHLFIFGPAGYRNITIVKYVSFLSLCGLYGLGMLWLAAGWLRREGFVALKKLRPDAVEVLVLLYLLLTLLSALCSEYFPMTLLGERRHEGLLTIWLYGLSFLLLARYARPGRWLLWLFAGVMTAFSLVCLLQLAEINVFRLFPEGYTYYDGNEKYTGVFLGTTGNAGLTAAVLTIAIPLFVVAVLRLEGWRRFLLLISMAMCLYVLLYTGVLAGIVGVAGGLFAALPFVLPMERRTRLRLLITQGLILLAVLAVLWCVDIGSGFLHELHAILNGEAEDSFGTGRIFIWRNTLPLVKEAPLLGGGPDTLVMRIGVQFERVTEDGTLKTASINAAHNEYLHILVCQGIPALMAYLGALLCSFVRFVRLGGRSAAASMLGAAVLSYGVQAFFGISMCISAPYFWLGWALFENSCRRKRNEEETEEAEEA